MKRARFPENAAREQKKAMKRVKWNMNNFTTFRAFANRMKKINDLIAHFPKLPDGSTPVPMPKDELHEALHDAMPWETFRSEVKRRKYDPSTDTFHGFIDWIKNCCEPFATRKEKASSGNLDKPIPKKNKRKNDNQTNGKVDTNPNKKQRKWCLHHKWCDHTTDDCKVVKSQMAKVAAYNKADKTKDFHAMALAEDFHATVEKR